MCVNRFYKKAAAFVLRAVAKHSPDLAQAVVDSGALDALVPCLEVCMTCLSAGNLNPLDGVSKAPPMVLLCTKHGVVTSYKAALCTPRGGDTTCFV